MFGLGVVFEIDGDYFGLWIGFWCVFGVFGCIGFVCYVVGCVVLIYCVVLCNVCVCDVGCDGVVEFFDCRVVDIDVGVVVDL